MTLVNVRCLAGATVIDKSMSMIFVLVRSAYLEKTMKVAAIEWIFTGYDCGVKRSHNVGLKKILETLNSPSAFLLE